MLHSGFQADVKKILVTYLITPTEKPSQASPSIIKGEKYNIKVRSSPIGLSGFTCLSPSHAQ